MLSDRYVICNTKPFANLHPFFKHCFKCKNRFLKSASYLLILVIRENEFFKSVIRDLLFLLFVNRARDSPTQELREVHPGGASITWILSMVLIRAHGLYLSNDAWSTRYARARTDIDVVNYATLRREQVRE